LRYAATGGFRRDACFIGIPFENASLDSGARKYDMICHVDISHVDPCPGTIYERAVRH
jgi:hypothetical protein